MPNQYRVRDATAGIPKGLLLEIDKLEQGGIVSAIGNPSYRFVIDRVIDYGDYTQIINSNAIANIEVIENG